MSEDIGQGAFLAEAKELLEVMESALLQLESDVGNTEVLAALFRAAHTIKGTGGVFGFDDVVEFTHVVENVLDKVRNGAIQIDSDLVAILLSCRDHIDLLVEHAVAEQTLDINAITNGKALHVDLQTYLGEPPVRNSCVASEISVTQSTLETISENAVISDDWHITVRFSIDVLRDGMDPLSFLRYLSRLGTIKNVVTANFCYEGFETMDPENCYTGLEIELDADVSKAEIEQVFEFVRDDCTLFILPPKSDIEHFIDIIETLSDEKGRIGSMLVQCGALTEKELKDLLQIQQMQNKKQANGESTPKIGEVMVEQRVVHQEVVDAVVEKQQTSKVISQANSTIRIDASKLDQLVNLVGEMVIAGASTNLIAHQLGDDNLIESISVMSRLVEEIRDGALRLRMVQVGDNFNRFKRVVRDVSRELRKDIELTIGGAETELDKTVVEKIGDPLMHLVRNAMDHGIESNEERLALGKTEKGQVGLNAYHDSGSIVIEVSDNGRGLDRDKLLAKAIEKGMATETQNLTDQEVYRLIFEAGFSTATTVTNLSGRGVGMDVVRKNIESLRGSVDIRSIRNEGTTIEIRLPLTLAIIDGFLVNVGETSYVIPLDMIYECVESDQGEFGAQLRQKHINLRGEVLPLLYLNDHFQVANSNSSNANKNIVVVQFAGLKAGLVVDSLLGEFQTVIKPLGKIFQRLKGVSGSTILGSGDVAIILDVPGLVQQVVVNNGLQAAKPAVSLQQTVH